jgi:hypothetical protein
MPKEMGHDKLDKKIQTTLAERKIQPRAAAWDSLDTMLSNQEKHPKRSWLFAAAASIVVLLGMVFIYHINSDQTAIVTQIVKDQSPEPASNPELKNNAVPQEVARTKTLKLQQESYEKKPDVLSETPNQHAHKPQPLTLKTNKKQPNNKIAAAHTASVKQELPAFQEATLVAHKRVNDSIALSREVDVLLAAAMEQVKFREIEKQPQTTTAYRVNPEMLLMEVEEDAEESFRAKVFEAVKKGFKKTKTAVATRNDN